MARHACEVEDKRENIVFIGDSVCTSFDVDIDWNANRLLLNAPPRSLKPRKELLDGQTRL
jgi:hypothetical protein